MCKVGKLFYITLELALNKAVIIPLMITKLNVNSDVTKGKYFHF